MKFFTKARVTGLITLVVVSYLLYLAYAKYGKKLKGDNTETTEVVDEGVTNDAPTRMGQSRYGAGYVMY